MLSHEWIRRFMAPLHQLRPDLTSEDTMEIAVDVHSVAFASEPEQAARYAARERVTTFRDQL
jgi:hypothetical protein